MGTGIIIGIVVMITFCLFLVGKLNLEIPYFSSIEKKSHLKMDVGENDAYKRRDSDKQTKTIYQIFSGGSIGYGWK